MDSTKQYKPQDAEDMERANQLLDDLIAIDGLLDLVPELKQKLSYLMNSYEEDKIILAINELEKILQQALNEFSENPDVTFKNYEIHEIDSKRKVLVCGLDLENVNFKALYKNLMSS